ncbi:hypothetical protein BH09MYX1_BH09MYX1_03710 [soil metagenome]
MRDRRRGDLTVARPGRDASTGACALQRRRSDEIVAAQRQHRKVSKEDGRFSRGGIGPKSRKNLLDDHAERHDVAAIRERAKTLDRTGNWGLPPQEHQ